MGFDIDRFVNLSTEIADYFKCSVCLDILEVPLEFPCGHIFCYECIRGHFRTSLSLSECPECRRPVRTADVKPPNRKLVCILHNLNIKCQYWSMGCTAVVKVENLIAHTRLCQYNQSSRSRGSSAESLQPPRTMSNLLASDANRFDRLERMQQVQVIIDAFAQAAIENNDANESNSTDTLPTSDDGALLIDNETPLWDRTKRWIGRGILFLFISALVTVQLGAIVISGVKLQSCTEMPTLPHALLVLGVMMLASVLLETVRSGWYPENRCIGLEIIKCLALGATVYLAVVVYTNLNYTGSSTVTRNGTLSCDPLVFDFSFWYVSTILSVIGVFMFTLLIYAIYQNLRNLYTEWTNGYGQFAFIYSVALIGFVTSIVTLVMDSIYFDSCTAIPTLTTRLVAFGAIGLVFWMVILLTSDYRSGCTCSFLIWLALLISFTCVAIDVHANFFRVTSSPKFIYDSINCDQTIYTYAFVVVCIHYAIITATIVMFFVYQGICSYLFFT